MSTVPPAGTPPPPPPPAGGTLPWENRGTMGAPEAFLETVKAFATNPRDTWSRTRESGDFGMPLLFAVIVGWIGAAANAIWGSIFLRGAIPVLPPEVASRFPFGRMPLGGTFLAVRLIVAPIGVVIGLFIGSAILHVCYLIVGALKGSTAGFEGTFRVAAYSSVASLGQIIPIVGGLIALVGWILLATFGGAKIHRTTEGKSLVAILIPIVLLCVCGVLAMVGIFAAIAGHGAWR